VGAPGTGPDRDLDATGMIGGGFDGWDWEQQASKPERLVSVTEDGDSN